MFRIVVQLIMKHERNNKEEKVLRIIGGDFNLVLDKDWDKTGGKYSTHEKAKDFLQSFMEEECMVDVWRVLHPEQKTATWKVLKPKPIFVRIDFFLISEELIDNVKNAEIAPTYLSDHAILWLVLSDTTLK